jgi:hypothetical protein
MKVKKFATQIDERVLKDLKMYVKEADRSISSVVSEAVAEYLQKARLRPAFRSAMAEVIDDHEDLLARLAK